MIATITLLAFLKCLGIVISGILGVVVVFILMVLFSDIVWPHIRKRIPNKVVEYGQIAIAILFLLLCVFMVFIAIPLAICTDSGGCA